MFDRVILLFLLAAPASVADAQGVDRTAFIELVLAISDQKEMASVFVPSEKNGWPVLYVEFPTGIQGVHSEETIERETEHGLVIMAHKKYIFFFQIRQWLVLQEIEHSENLVQAYFRTYSLADAPVPIPIIKGSVKLRPENGVKEVRFLKQIPSDKEFKR